MKGDTSMTKTLSVLSARKTSLQKKKSKKGFTLIELVVVIAILAIIAAIAIPMVSNVIKNANNSTDLSNAQLVESTIKQAQAECAGNASSPSTEAGTIITATDKTAKTILSTYGIDPNIIDKPKNPNDKFYYNTTTGKVTAAETAPGTDFKQITSGTAYKITVSGGGSGATTDSAKLEISL